ncbi:hypothetical protein A1OO_18635 [Enterovibrio norvegicus FF-33]|uniref:DUF805 domain-containing protein n=1 Tax=Enterovibrio norvegicus FF-454 TaxID=1185651 RepID=A0A1E5C0N9_9GAMM|nr:DUF805 domain-containing protein [Enterovibrio norvegicus]OEE59087.1 hypothetical protein A1OK_03500 [Enterovibrio norvegicus FF-454]OEE67755.1 hypothetical protein A1OO_18635 [Enterovibrio norvegicus FF-33]OEE86224.1 hypothetical protein A1OQ_17090 [Enterovibrio norvegicus FF-162]
MNNQKWALFSFEGRMRRRDYWLYSVPVLVMVLPTFFYQGGHVVLDALSIAISLFAIYASVALNIKRLKDRNKSPWWLVVTFLPLIGPIFALVELGILDGTPGPNQFGPDPKGRGDKSDQGGNSVREDKEKDTAVFEG